MAVSDAEIQNWWAQNSGLNDAQILSAMKQYDVPLERMVNVLGWNPDESSQRYDSATNLVTQQLTDYLTDNAAANREAVNAAANPLGYSQALVDMAYNNVANNAYTQQFGRAIQEAEVAAALDWLNQGHGLTAGLQKLNNTQEGYNYDTQDIVSAYRSVLGVNPDQDQYVKAMAELGLNNFDRASLGTPGSYANAVVAALEADPYAGRYAGYNPYDLPADAVNVSTNILGDKVQYTSPVTQRPVVADVVDGKVVLSDGQDTMTQGEVAAAINLATSTGALTETERQQLLTGLDSAKSMDDVYSVFSQPKATITFDPKFGLQTGVGKSLEEAVASRPVGIDNIIADLANEIGGALPSFDSVVKAVNDDVEDKIFNISGDTSTGTGTGTGTSTGTGTGTGTGTRTGTGTGIFTPGLYNNVYVGQVPSTGADVITSGNFPFKIDQIKAGVADFQNTKETNNSGQVFGGWKDRKTFGASDGQLMGAGTADYNSSLIKSLRQASMTPFSNNAGIQLVPNQSTVQTDWTPPMQSDAAFNPSVLNPRAATGQEVADWNAYQTYKTNSLGAKTPILSLADWIAGGRSDGKPVAQTPAPDYDASLYQA